jgi:hypothetical protein
MISAMRNVRSKASCPISSRLPLLAAGMSAACSDFTFILRERSARVFYRDCADWLDIARDFMQARMIGHRRGRHLSRLGASRRALQNASDARYYQSCLQLYSSRDGAHDAAIDAQRGRPQARRTSRPESACRRIIEPLSAPQLTSAARAGCAPWRPQSGSPAD